MKPHAILLEPAKGDPLGLLASTLDRYPPPHAWMPSGRQHGVWWLSSGDPALTSAPVALVLAWEGVVVPEGLFRLASVHGLTSYDLSLLPALQEFLTGDPSGWAKEVFRPAGRIVRLDAVGREL